MAVSNHASTLNTAVTVYRQVRLALIAEFRTGSTCDRIDPRLCLTVRQWFHPIVHVRKHDV